MKDAIFAYNRRRSVYTDAGATVFAPVVQISGAAFDGAVPGVSASGAAADTATPAPQVAASDGALTVPQNPGCAGTVSAAQVAASGSVPGCGGIAAAVPLCDEYPGFLHTLTSLEISYKDRACSGISGNRGMPFHIVCVVNNRKTAACSVKEHNRQLLDCLVAWKPAAGITLSVIDCAGDGREIPDDQGVGYARKIGMDYALLQGAQVIACLDGDTTVSRNWYGQLCLFAEKYGGRTAAALSGFCHQPAETERIQCAINVYEDFLIQHAEKLRRCGTPFWRVALGPTIVCTAEAYAACGGMNMRIAGEDFYFLQKLIKVTLPYGGVQSLSCQVYPSSRLSGRVLFGTGTKLQELTAGGAPFPVADSASYKRNPLLYPEEVYAKLARFISLFYEAYAKTETAGEESIACATGSFFSAVADTVPDIYAFLQTDGFTAQWPGIARTNRKSFRRLSQAFHCRFDGLKIIRCIHWCVRNQTVR